MNKKHFSHGLHFNHTNQKIIMARIKDPNACRLICHMIAVKSKKTHTDTISVN